MYESLSKIGECFRCLGLLANMKAFRKCCPFHKEIRGEIILALKKGTAEWYEQSQAEVFIQFRGKEGSNDIESSLLALTHLVTLFQVDLQTGIQAFNPLFEL